MNFDLAFEKLIGHEGGYVNDARDPGGETKFGISKRSYPAEDIAGMTLMRARELYRRDFWDAVRADEMPDAIRFDLFDAAVNSGVRQSIRWLQRSANVIDDGVIGPKTLLAVRIADPQRLSRRFNGHRLQFMAGLGGWSRFGRGWARRIAANLME